MPNEIWAAIVGALVGAWITYRFALTLAEKQFGHLRELSKIEARRSAARDFFEAFAPELAILRSGASTMLDVTDLLRDAFNSRHSRAVEIFGRHLPSTERAAFFDDWLRHCYGCTETGEPMSPNDADLGMPHDTLLYLHFSEHFPGAGSQGSRLRALLSLERLTAYAADH
jgi:hypothetical protein